MNCSEFGGTNRQVATRVVARRKMVFFFHGIHFPDEEGTENFVSDVFVMAELTSSDLNQMNRLEFGGINRQVATLVTCDS